MNIQSNLKALREKIERSAERAGRDPDAIELVVVTKTVGIAEIKEAIDCGVRVIGESRVHEALAKQPEIGRDIQWHMIGHLQSRKAKQAVGLFDMVHSLESMSTAKALQKRCSETGDFLPVLIEVNTSNEEQKYGLSPEAVESFVIEVASMSELRIKGLMTMAAFVPDPEETRPSFRLLRDLAETLKEKNIENASFDILSMGMSNDFEIAIEEGSTMLRVGSAIFAE